MRSEDEINQSGYTVASLLVVMDDIVKRGQQFFAALERDKNLHSSTSSNGKRGKKKT